MCKQALIFKTTQHAIKLNSNGFVNSNGKNIHSNHWLMVCVHYGIVFNFIEKDWKKCSK